MLFEFHLGDRVEYPRATIYDTTYVIVGFESDRNSTQEFARVSNGRGDFWTIDIDLLRLISRKARRNHGC